MRKKGTQKTFWDVLMIGPGLRVLDTLWHGKATNKSFLSAIVQKRSRKSRAESVDPSDLKALNVSVAIAGSLRRSEN